MKLTQALFSGEQRGASCQPFVTDVAALFGSVILESEPAETPPEESRASGNEWTKQEKIKRSELRPPTCLQAADQEQARRLCQLPVLAG